MAAIPFQGVEVHLDFDANSTTLNSIVQHLNYSIGDEKNVSYKIKRFETKEEIQAFYEILNSLHDPLTPGFLPPFQLKNDVQFYLAFEKLGASLNEVLDKKLFKFTEVYEMHRRRVSLWISTKYAQIIRDIFNMIWRLGFTGLHAQLHVKDIFIVHNQINHVEAKILGFKLRGGGDDYDKDCKEFVSFLRTINRRCHVGDIAKAEFKAFYDCVVHIPSILDHRSQVLSHHLFWTVSKRISFICELDDYVKANGKVVDPAIYRDLFGTDGSWMNILLSDDHMEQLLGQYHDDVMERGLRNQYGNLFLTPGQSFIASTPGQSVTITCCSRQSVTISYEKSILLWLEMIRDIYWHWFRMRETLMRSGIQLRFKNVEEVQRTIQVLFPMHICKLVAEAEKIGFTFVEN